MSTNPRARAWVELRGDALVENFGRVRDAVGPDVGILPMVKADAYGLGVGGVVSRLAPLDPWGWGVATVAEGAALRAAGVGGRILVCSPIPPGGTEAAVRLGLDLMVSSLDALESAACAAERSGSVARLHCDVDTGMGRSGFDWTGAAEWGPAFAHARDRGVRLVGCATHLHSADDDPGTVPEQLARFDEARAALPDDDGAVLVHVLNSAGAFRVPERAGALVRPGIFLYGGHIGPGQPAPAPVVSIRARVVHVRDVAAGATVGYGATHRASGPGRWATLSVGYGDGYPRSLGNRGRALLHGRSVPVVGRISMDVTVVDISGVPSVSVGDVATLLGTDRNETIGLDELAEEAGTISYEILTGLTGRLPRTWRDGSGETDG